MRRGTRAVLDKPSFELDEIVGDVGTDDEVPTAMKRFQTKTTKAKERQRQQTELRDMRGEFEFEDEEDTDNPAKALLRDTKVNENTEFREDVTTDERGPRIGGRDVAVYNVADYPPIFHGGCCMDGHDFTMSLMFIIVFTLAALIGAVVIVASDTLGDTSTDSFKVGISFFVVGSILAGASVYYFNMQAARRITTLVYTFDEGQVSADSTYENPQPSLRAQEEADMMYANLTGYMNVVTTLVPVMYTTTLMMIGIAIMSLRAFNERHDTLVIAILLYVTAAIMIYFMLAYAWKRERNLALVMAVRHDLLDFLNPEGAAQPGVYSYVGTSELPNSNDDLVITGVRSTLRRQAAKDVGSSFELMGSSNIHQSALGERLRTDAKMRMEQIRAARIKEQEERQLQRLGKQIER